jgi:ABC-2 type transport system permease protein
MNLRAMRAIAAKDLAVVRRSKAVMLPLIIVPLIMVLILPIVASFAPALANVPGASDLGALVEQMPEAFQAEMAHLSEEQRLVVVLLVYLFAPLFLVVPMMVASVIAADAFAGEKERKTLEALLHTPTSDTELVLAKFAVGFVPAVLVAWGAFALYTLVANVAAWPVMGRVFFPTPMWWVLALLVAPGVAAFGLGATVIVSARVSTFQEAYQIGGLVVLPLILLVVGQAAGVVFLSTAVVAFVGVVFWLLAAGLLAVALRTFRRGELLART